VARAIWSGAISFGLVSIPVRLYGATEPKDVRFHQFEKDTGKRIHNKRVAEDTDREVDFEDIVKGYEVEKGQFVLVTPEELEAAEPERSRTIEIEDFVDLSEIDPVYFEKTYYLAPAEESGAERPYLLLLRAMEDTNKVGIGRFVLRSKEYLAAIRPTEGLLALETMFFSDEVRTVEDVENVPVKARVGQRELDVARQLIESQSTSWDPSRYEDTHRERVLELIRRKAKGEEIVTEPEAEPTPMGDLMDALRASVEAARQGKRPRATAGGDGSGKAKGSGAYEEWSKERLLERAAELDIAGRSKMSKKELARALRRAS
jgi:DNA end-binding protein Ku